MGIQKGVVQKIIFHSLDNGKLGVNILDGVPYFHLLLVDNMLHMHAACLSPFADEKESHSEEEIARHIVTGVARNYSYLARHAKIMVLCDDGCRNFKPAVREARERAPMTEAALYMQRNMAKLRTDLFNTMEEDGLMFVYMRGTGKDNARGSIVVSQECPTEGLHLDAFARIFLSSESDTLMFEYVRHLRRNGTALSVGIYSKDSDILPTAYMMLDAHGTDCLGDTVLCFNNPLLNSTGKHSKDFPAVVGHCGWIPGVHPQRDRPCTTPGILDNALWNLMYDCLDARKHFEEPISRVEEQVVMVREDPAALVRLFGGLRTHGIVGPLFRRFVEWTLHSADEMFNVAVRSFRRSAEAGDTKNLMKNYKDLLDGWITTVPDSFGPGAKSHVPDIVRCGKRYLAGEFAFGAYGDYLSALKPNRSTIYMRVHVTEFTKSCAVLCALAGSDYNISMVKLGEQAIVELLTNRAFAKVCREGVDSKHLPEACSRMKELINVTRLGYKEGELPKSTIDLYLEGVYRTLLYTLDTWALRFPVVNEQYGFRGEGFVFPLVEHRKALQKAIGQGKAYLRF